MVLERVVRVTIPIVGIPVMANTRLRPTAIGWRMWLGLASIVMLFAGLSSAYIIRSGGASDWRAISIPGFLIPNSIILLASSVTLEMFRRRLTVALTPEGTAVDWHHHTAWNSLSGWPDQHLEDARRAGNLSELEFSQLFLLSDDRGARRALGWGCHQRCWFWQECPGGRFMQPAGFGYSQM